MTTTLLRGGAKSAHVHPTRGTALHVASARGNVQVVQALLKADDAVDAIVSTTRDTKRTALHCAVIGNTPHSHVVAAMLLSIGATANAQDSMGDTPLLTAVKRAGQLECVKVLVNAGTPLISC